MEPNGQLAPAVESILQSARARSGGQSRVSVSARSLDVAFDRAEAAGHIPVIAEVKPTSPTTESRHDGNPVEIAEAMVEGGAAALSVLTEPDHFGGDPALLERIRSTVDVPVLRKDFILREDHLDVIEADLILLIVRFLEDTLEELITGARERGFQPLVEVHTREEMEKARSVDAELIGINNRDLGQLAVDLATFEKVAPAAPPGSTLIAESGMKTPADVRRMRAAGADGVLIGTAIMNGNVRRTTKRFVSA